MAKKLSFFFAAFAIVMLSSCGGKMSPGVYNETIVNLHEKSYDYLNERQERIFDYENTSKEEAAQLVDSLSTKFDGYVKYLDGLKYPDEAADWHKVTTQLFVYTKDSVIPLYSETLKFEPESKEWYNVWNEIDARMKGRASQIEDQMIAEQVKFAQASGQQLR